MGISRTSFTHGLWLITQQKSLIQLHTATFSCIAHTHCHHAPYNALSILRRWRDDFNNNDEDMHISYVEEEDDITHNDNIDYTTTLTTDTTNTHSSNSIPSSLAPHLTPQPNNQPSLHGTSTLSLRHVRAGNINHPSTTWALPPPKSGIYIILNGRRSRASRLAHVCQHLQSPTPLKSIPALSHTVAHQHHPRR